LLSLQYVNTLISTFAAWCVLMIRNVMLGDKIANRRYICRTILGQGQSPERLTGMQYSLIVQCRRQWTGSAQ